MATRSLLFGCIALLQIIAFALLAVTYIPGMMYFEWKVFSKVDNQLALELRDEGKDMVYGLWHHCIEGKQDTCELIEDGDVVVSSDLRLNELMGARVLQVVATLFALLTFVTAVANTCHRREIITTIHLASALAQLLPAMVSAALATHVMRVGDPDWSECSVGWVLYIYYVTVGFMILVLFISFLAPCMYISYTDDEEHDDYFEPKKSDPNSYVLSQHF